MRGYAPLPLKGTICSSLPVISSVCSFWPLPVLFDPSQQGLQPPNSALAVSVEEGDDLTCGGRCPPQPGSDQTRTLLHPEDPHRHLQSPRIIL